MAMLAVHNGREREEDEYEPLFTEADKRFTDVKVFKPEGSGYAIAEATWKE